jgi:hypothetical protein
VSAPDLDSEVPAEPVADPLVRVASTLFLAFIVELSFGGSLGFQVFGLPVRKVLVMALLLCGPIDMIRQRRVFLWQAQLCLVVGGVGLGWGLLVPAARGTPLAYAVADFAPFLYLLLVLPIVLASREKGLAPYVDFANWCIAIVAAMVIVAWGLATFLGSPEFALLLRLFFLEASGRDFGMYIGPMPDGSFRVMWITCLFFPFMMAYKNLDGIRYGWSAFYLLACFASGTRSFLYASLFMLGISLVRHTPAWAIRLAPLLIVGFIAASQIFPDVRILQFASDLESGSRRGDQLFSLLRLFGENPLLGAGFGANAETIRLEPEVNYELTYVALLAKVGLVGFLLLGFAAAASVFRVMSEYRGRIPEIALFVVSFVFITSTNPYLLNVVGLTLLSAMLAVVYGYPQLEQGRAK